MTGPSWLIDSKRIASKIKSASETVDISRVKWKSNPTKACPNCNHIIDNSDVVQEWPGLPRGVKFDPSDQELLSHLIAKVGKHDLKPHPFIDEFIPTVDNDDGICYTHPQKLPGVKQDGSVSHFFHRTFKAYNTGTRKRRKINNDDCDVRWHKTGKTKPVIIDGKHIGCKKIMVLYMSTTKGERPEKTNWVMHQYHLGTGEDERDGELVVSKVFYQQSKPGDKTGLDLHPGVVEIDETIAIKGPLYNPADVGNDPDPLPISSMMTCENLDDQQHDNPCPPKRSYQETVCNESQTEETCAVTELERLEDQDNLHTDDTKWWEGESQFLLDSQQLAEGIAICDEFLQSQTSCGGDSTEHNKPRLSDYAVIGVDDLKKDLQECQNLSTGDQTNLELETPPDMRLSQIEFGSQDSFLMWPGSKLVD